MSKKLILKLYLKLFRYKMNIFITGVAEYIGSATSYLLLKKSIKLLIQILFIKK